MVDLTIVPIETEFYGEIPPDQVLEGAKDQLQEVVIVGVDKDGELWLSGSHSSVAGTNLLLDRAKANLMRSIDD